MNFLKLYDIFLYSNLILVGLIWVIQLVHYPSFKFIDQLEFARFNEFHQMRISFVVIPCMLVELFSGVVLTFGWEFQVYQVPVIASLMILFLIWVHTFTFFVPLHRSFLAGEKKDLLIKKLVMHNWVRTLAWSSKAIILIVYYPQI